LQFERIVNTEILLSVPSTVVLFETLRSWVEDPELEDEEDDEENKSPDHENSSKGENSDHEVKSLVDSNPEEVVTLTGAIELLANSSADPINVPPSTSTVAVLETVASGVKTRAKLVKN
jgi:hypothetical protein